MRKEVIPLWLYSPSVVLILKFLAIKPRTPLQLKMSTKIPGNYVNIILKKLEFLRIVKCLTPEEKIGKVFCVNPQSKDIVEKILKWAGYKTLKVRCLPNLNWKAYGRLNCRTDEQIRKKNQLRKIFNEAVKLRNIGISVTELNLEAELRKKNGILEIDRSDIYRALRRLKALCILVSVKKRGSYLEYEITLEGLALNEFMNS